jgi:hypothetical protein
VPETQAFYSAYFNFLIASDWLAFPEGVLAHGAWSGLELVFGGKRKEKQAGLASCGSNY